MTFVNSLIAYGTRYSIMIYRETATYDSFGSDSFRSSEPKETNALNACNK